MNTLTVLAETAPVLSALLPMQIDIDPNSSGLPGINQLRTIVGAVMTVGLILSVLALIVSAIVWGFGANSSQPASRRSREDRRPRLLWCGDHLRRIGDADQLLLERRAVRLTPNHEQCREGVMCGERSATSPSSPTVCDVAGEATATLVSAPFDWLAQAMAASRRVALRSGLERCLTPPPSSTSSDPGYIGVYNVLFGVAVFMMLIFFCLQLITGLIRRDPTALIPRRPRTRQSRPRIIRRHHASLALLLEITDQLTIGIVQATGEHDGRHGRPDRPARRWPRRDQHRRPRSRCDHHDLPRRPRHHCGGDRLVQSLLIRKALLLVAIVFAPIALSGAVVGCDQRLVHASGQHS